MVSEAMHLISLISRCFFNVVKFKKWTCRHGGDSIIQMLLPGHQMTAGDL